MSNKNSENEDFKKYREQMHADSADEDYDERPAGNKVVRIAFTIFMVIIYVGMGVLLYMNFFGWDDQYAWMRYFIGTILVIYGAWRGYRQYAGIDSRL